MKDGWTITPMIATRIIAIAVIGKRTLTKATIANTERSATVRETDAGADYPPPAFNRELIHVLNSLAVKRSCCVRLRFRPTQ